MLRFKSFLKEQTSLINPIFRIFICFIESSGENTAQNFVENFNEELAGEISKKVDSRLRVDGIFKQAKSISYEMDLNESTANDYDLLNGIHGNLIAEWDKTLKNTAYDVIEESSNSQIVCEKTLPPYKIDYDIISILCEEDMSLSRIDKIIGDHCEELYLNYSHRITGGVLGLLKLPKNTKIIGPTSEKWWTIIKKHLGTRDILACHEELVDNGLEEYAQL